MFKKIRGLLMRTGLNKEQQAKYDSVLKTLEEVKQNVVLYLKTESRMLTLTDYQIIYSTTHALFEQQAMKTLLETGEVRLPSGTGGEPIVVKASDLVVK